MNAEKFVSPKQIQAAFQTRGVEYGIGYFRALVREADGNLHGRYIRFTDAWNYWMLHPEFRPYSRKPDKKSNKHHDEAA